MKKRMLALVLTVAMLLSLFPGQVFATETETEHTEHNFVEVQPETEAPAEELPNATETETPTELPDATEELIETPTDDITETPTEPREEQVAVTPQNPIEGVTVPSVEELSGTVGQIKATPKADDGHNHCLLSHDCLDRADFGEDCPHFKNYIGIDTQWFVDIVNGKKVDGVRYQTGTTNILYLGTTQTVSFYLKEKVTLPGTIDKIVIEPDVPPLPGEEFAVNLCLNGFQLNLTERQIQVYAYGDLRISDCKLNDGDQGNIVSKYDGSTIHVYPNGILRLYDGTVRNIRETGKDTICAVYSTGTVYAFDTTVWSYFLGLFSVGGESVIRGGHFEGQSAIYQKDGGQLTIEDGTFTSTSNRALQIAAGTVDISGGTISSENGRAIHAAGGELNISGGTISSENGRAIHAAGGELNISGGTISSKNGRAIHATGGELNISGGTIESEYLHTVHIEGAEAKVNITGGAITHKRPESVEEPKDADNNVDHQYAVALGNGTLTVNGAKAEIDGTRDTALFVGENATATLTAGKISTTGAGMHGLYNKGETTINGSNLNIQSSHYGIFNDLETADLTITAGTIKGFHGIYNKNGATLNLSGSPEIKGSAKGSDVYLHVPSKATDGTVKYNYITVNGPLNPGGDGTIAVLTKPEPTYGSPVQFTLEWDESDCVMDKFVSARAWYRVELTEDGKELQLALIPHDHCKYGHNYPEGESCGHGEINFKIPLTAAMFEEFAKNKILPEGDYYLVEPIEYTDESLTVSGNVNLCLNGFTITANNSTITVGSTSVLSVYDCDGEGSLVCHHFTLPARSTSTASELHLYGGLIVLSSSSGLGVIDVGGYDIFELDGATIEINSTSTDPGFIYKAGQGGSVHLKSGEIRHNASIPSIYSYGSGALNLQGWVRIDGGTDSPDIQLYASKTNKRIITITGRVTPPEDDSVYTVKLFTSLNITEYQLTNNWEESGLSSKDSDTGKAQIPFVSTQGYAIIEKVADEATGKKELFLVLPEVRTADDGNGNLTMTSPDAVDVRVGSTITLTAKPDDGYKIGEVTVTYKDATGNDVTVPVTNIGNGTYTFTMPNDELVECHATFTKLHRHYMAVDTEKGSDVTTAPMIFQEIDSADTLAKYIVNDVLQPGDYVLTNDVSYGTNFSVDGETNLCLNGYTLNLGESHIVVRENAVLNICDCHTDGGGEGTITSTINSATINGYAGTLNLYGGTIANTRPTDQIATGTNIDTTCAIRGAYMINMFGGKAYSPTSHGVLVAKGDMNMYGGEIKVVAKNMIALLMRYSAEDVTITGGTITSDNYLGIQFHAGDTLTIDGDVTVTGSTGIVTYCGETTINKAVITGRTSNGITAYSGEITLGSNAVITGKGKGISMASSKEVAAPATVNIPAGSVTGISNAAVDIVVGTLNLTGGELHSDAVGVNMTGGTFKLSGNPVITGGQGGASIHLASGKTITIDGAITAPTGAYTVKTADTPTDVKPVQITTGWSDDATNKANKNYPFVHYQGTYGVGQFKVAETSKDELHFYVSHTHGINDYVYGTRLVDAMRSVQEGQEVGGGYYFLTEDLKIDGKLLSVNGGGDVYICLNGQTLTVTADIQTHHAKIHICDCGNGIVKCNRFFPTDSGIIHVEHAVASASVNDSPVYCGAGGVFILENATLYCDPGTHEEGGPCGYKSDSSIEIISSTIINKSTSGPALLYYVGSLKMEGSVKLDSGDNTGDIFFYEKGVVTITGPLTPPDGETYTVKLRKNLSPNGYLLTSGWEEKSGLASHYDEDGNFVPAIIPFESTQGYAVEEQIDEVTGKKELYLVLPTVTTDVTPAEGGSLTSDPRICLGGTTVVTLTPDANDGYRLVSVVATYVEKGVTKTLTLTEVDGTYTFTMPSAHVTAIATYVEMHRHYMAVDTENGTDVETDKVTFTHEIDSVSDMKIYPIPEENREYDMVGNDEYGLDTGSYVLTADLTLDKFLSIRGDVNLCLNGHKLDLGGNAIIFNEHGNLNICDCNSSGSEDGGVITSANYNSTIRFASGTLNLYGGTIDHPVGHSESDNVRDNDNVLILPSAIRCHGTLNVYDGTVHSYHHGIYTVNENAVVNITGGTINAEVAGEYNGGSGIYASTCDTITIDGEKVKIYGRPGISALDGNTIITAGTVTSGLSNGIFINGGTVTVREDAVVRGRFDAIHLTSGALKLADAPDIASTQTKFADIFLETGMVITIIDEIKDTYIVDTREQPTVDKPVRITADWNVNAVNKNMVYYPFVSMDGYLIRKIAHEGDAAELYLVIPQVAGEIYSWKDHTIILSEVALLNALKSWDTKGYIFVNGRNYSITSVTTENLTNMTVTGYEFKGVEVGQGNGKLKIAVTDNDKESFVLTVELVSNVYKVENSVFVLDYAKPVKLTDSLYEQDILPGVEKKEVNVLFEIYANNKPKMSDDGQSMAVPAFDGKGNYGTFSVKDGVAIYTPYNGVTLDGIDKIFGVFRVYDKDAEASEIGTINPFKEVEMYKEIVVIPANVVYYEDTHEAIKWNTQDNDGIDIKPVGAPTGDGYQDGDNSSEYGNDSDYAYAPEGEYYGSGGHSKKIIVNANGPILSFSFTGTGFDLIGSTTADSGQFMYKIYRGETLIKSGALNTSYKGDGKNADAAIYEVPLLHVIDLAYGTYDVLIQASVSYDFTGNREDWVNNKPPVKTAYLYFDGVRVYNPIAMDSADRKYYIDGEDTARFVQLRNMILSGQAAAAKIDKDGLFSFGSGLVSYVEKAQNRLTYEGNKVTSLNDYLVAGPNNEVYFNENTQTLVLYVKETGEDGVTPMLQLAIRNLNPDAFDKAEGDTKYAPKVALLGVGGAVVQQLVNDKVDDKTVAISYTEQYHTVDYTNCVVEKINGENYYRVVITAQNSSAFALTNLKVSGLEFYTIPASAATYKYDKNGELMESSNPNATEMPSLQELAWQLQAANGMLPEDDTPVENAPDLKFTSISLSLQSSIGMNFYVEEALLAQYETPYIYVTMEGRDFDPADGSVGMKLETYETVTMSNGKTYRVYRFEEAKSTEMTATVVATIFGSETVRGESREYSVVQYAKNMIGKGNDAFKTLLVDMVNYGAQAQIYFNHNTDNLANADFDAYQQYASQSVAPYVSCSESEGADDYAFQMVGASLSLKSRVEINFLVQSNKGRSFEGTKLVVTYFDVSGNTVVKEIPYGSEDFEVYGTNAYKVNFSDLNATDMRTPVTAWLADESGMRISNSKTYSIESYAASKAGLEGEENLKLLLETMMKYGDSAERYFYSTKTGE